MMNFNGGVSMFLSLNMDGVNGKHLIASMLGEGSLIVIGLFVVLAILVAVIFFLRKKKKDNKGDNKDE